MPTIATRRTGWLPKLATLALTFILLSIFASDASAQSGGGLRAYYQRFYGQDFYAPRRVGRYTREGYLRQDFGPIYGPVQMYTRQYGDEYGYATDRPFARRLPGQVGNRPSR